jgi:hypothetical protein
VSLQVKQKAGRHTRAMRTMVPAGSPLYEAKKAKKSQVKETQNCKEKSKP